MITLLYAALFACTPSPPTPPAAADPAPTEVAPTEVAPSPAPPDATTAPSPEPAMEPPEAPEPPIEPDPSSQPASPGGLVGGTTKPQVATPQPAGSPCLDGSACASGVCEGEGCGDDAPGVCAPDRRACTRDARQYCGCDGDTFVAGGNCPMQRYAHKGPCTPVPPE